MNKNSLFQAVWQLKPNQIREKVIISPIIYPKQFEQVAGLKGKHYRSDLAYTIANYKSLTFIKTPMTQAAVYDAVLLLKQTKCKEVVFIGAIGAIKPGVKVGDLIVSQSSGQVYSVNSFHEETKKKLLSLRKKGVIGVDFESRLFFKAASEIGVMPAAYYVVTDLPLTRPFYIKRTKSEEKRIQAAINQIIYSALSL